jgi:hypothetical protein
MTPSTKRMTVLDGLSNAVDWAELGRRSRIAAAEAAELQIDPAFILGKHRQVPRSGTSENVEQS